MPLVPIIPISGLKRCILPPRPCEQPVTRPEEFRDHLARGDALGQGMPVSAVGAEDGVVGAQVRAHPAGDGLFAHIGVASAVDQAHLVRAGQLLLGVADNDHLPVESVELLRLGHNPHLLCDGLVDHLCTCSFCAAPDGRPQKTYTLVAMGIPGWEPLTFLARLPPSSGISAPVIQAEASEARKIAAPLMSLG